MPEMTYDKHLTDQQLGAAFRGALQLNGIYNEIGDTTPPLQRLLADVDHEVQKLFPEVARKVRAEQIQLYKDSVNAVFHALQNQRDVLLNRTEEFFEEFRLDSAHDAIQEQRDGATFEQVAEDDVATHPSHYPLEQMFDTVAATIQREIASRSASNGK